MCNADHVMHCFKDVCDTYAHEAYKYSFFLYL